MLLKDFYTVIRRSGPETEFSPSGIPTEKYSFELELNPAHPVYAGHFPGNPVVPGVCQVQMITELLSGTLGSDLRLLSADNVKFMSLMVPGRTRVIDAELNIKTAENGEISANAILSEGETIFIKFKGLFRKEL